MQRPVHFEIHADDPVAAASFYSSLFGWSVQQWGDHPYWLVTTGDEAPGIDGAITPTAHDGQAVVITMQVEDIDSYPALLAEAGGTVVHDKAAIPGVGWLITAADPNGVRFGLMQPDENAG